MLFGTVPFNNELIQLSLNSGERCRMSENIVKERMH